MCHQLKEIQEELSRLGSIRDDKSFTGFSLRPCSFKMPKSQVEEQAGSVDIRLGDRDSCGGKRLEACSFWHQKEGSCSI